MIEVLTQTYEDYIDSEWRAFETGDTFEIYNPADIDEVITTVQDSSAEDTRGAIEVTAAVQDEWVNG